jgi:moderate conductance mechanosensitive channel
VIRWDSFATVFAQQPLWIRRIDRLHLLTPLRIVAIVVLALLATAVVRVPVKRWLRNVGSHTGSPDLGRPGGGARQQAMASVLRSTLIGVIWTIAVITIVGEVGVNIGGVIATATVIGGALAFGAQTLIRDVIAGFFVLAEDQYGVGDTVDLGLASGVVERITLRSAQLRDGDGLIWHIPHGNVQRSANSSRARTIHLDVDVARTMRLAAATAAISAACATLASQVGPALIGEPVGPAVSTIGDDRLVLRVVVSVEHNTQDEVKRLWRLIVLDAFERGELVAPPSAATAYALHAGPWSAGPGSVVVGGDQTGQ